MIRTWRSGQVPCACARLVSKTEAADAPASKARRVILTDWIFILFPPTRTIQPVRAEERNRRFPQGDRPRGHRKLDLSFSWRCDHPSSASAIGFTQLPQVVVWGFPPPSQIGGF